jgi:hypothetical protein
MEQIPLRQKLIPAGGQGCPSEPALHLPEILSGGWDGECIVINGPLSERFHRA